MKRKIYAILIFLILAAPIYYFSAKGLQGITGHAIKTNDGTSSNGIYRINPDFQVRMDRSLDAYKDMRQKARTLVSEVQKCELTRLTEECLKSLASWPISCGDDEEKLFTEIAENYMQCSASDDNYCLCEIKPDKYAKGDYMMLIEDNDGTYLKLGENEQMVKGVHPDLASGPIIRDSGTNGTYEIEMEYDALALDELKVRVKKENIVSEYKFKDTLYFFKIDDQMILVPLDVYEKARVQSKDPGIELRNCWMPNKRIYKFCPNDKTTYVKDNVVGNHDLIYRFALDFSDNVPPPQVEMTRASNIVDSKESLFLAWQDSTAPDFDHYMLFVSKEPFTSIIGMQPAAFLKENQYIMKVYPEKDNLLKIKDGTKYYVSVIPVDKSNNHVTEIRYQMSGMSEDNTQIP